MARKQNPSQTAKRSQKRYENSSEAPSVGTIDNTRLSSDMGETNDSLLEANRIENSQDHQMDEGLHSQPSSRSDEGDFGERSRDRRPGTFGIEDTPNARPGSRASQSAIDETLEETLKSDERR